MARKAKAKTSAKSGSVKEWQGAVCCGCGSLCDDLTLRRDARGTRAVANACKLGKEWLAGLPAAPRYLVSGAESTREDAVARAADALRAAKAPLFLGLSGLSNEALAAAATLGEHAGATLVPFPAPPLALVRSGIDAPEVAATWTEVRATADCVLLWRLAIMRTHPRHAERYIGAGLLAEGVTRRIVDVGDARSRQRVKEPGTVLYGLTLGARPGLEADLEIVRRLHETLAETGVAADPGGDDVQTKHERAAANFLAESVRGAAHTHVILGPAALAERSLWNEWQRLAAAVRAKHRITLESAPATGNVRGVAEVLATRVGRTGEVDPEEALESGRPDLVFTLGASLEELPAKVTAALAELPHIHLGGAAAPTALAAFECATLDPGSAATVTRADGINLTLSGTPGEGEPDLAAELLGELAAALDGQPPGAPREGRAAG